MEKHLFTIVQTIWVSLLHHSFFLSSVKYFVDIKIQKVETRKRGHCSGFYEYALMLQR
ncbi:hypothetical protein WN943_004496 [Citrus x changshan-huyou]